MTGEAEQDALADLEDLLWEQALGESDDPVWRAMAWVSELVPADELERCAWQVHAVKQLRRTLDVFLSVAEPQLAELMPEKLVTLEGLPPFEKRRGSVRKRWDSERLVPTLVRLALDPDGTGELPPTMEAVERVTSVLTECAPFTGSMGWRVGALRARGVDPDEWCESEPGKVSVQWHGGDR